MSDVKIEPRSAWGADPPTRRHRITLPTPELWLHHTAGALDANGNGVWDDDLRGIQHFHMSEEPEGRGWSDIAYSFLISPNGVIWEGRGAGIAGGHTKGRNTFSHGIALIGNFHGPHKPTEAAIVALVMLVAHGHRSGWWPSQITGPHRDAPGAATDCCGRDLIALIPLLNKAIAEQLEGPDDMATPEQVTKLQRFIQAEVPAALPRFGADGDWGDETDAGLDALIAHVGALKARIVELGEPALTDEQTRDLEIAEHFRRACDTWRNG